LGVPILPPYYALRLLPYVVPLVEGWRTSMLRERDMTDMFDLEIGGYIVNRVIPPALAQQKIPDYLRHRLDVQSGCLNEIDATFGAEVLARIPEKDPLMDYLLNFRERMEHAKMLLVVVNMPIDESSVHEDAPEFVLNRVAMQVDYMKDIWASFPDVRSVLPLFETKVRGVPMLGRTADAMFG
jgi:anion-transporting  ArsA/GET3 family ATPase